MREKLQESMPLCDKEQYRHLFLSELLNKFRLFKGNKVNLKEFNNERGKRKASNFGSFMEVNRGINPHY